MQALCMQASSHEVAAEARRGSVEKPQALSHSLCFACVVVLYVIGYVRSHHILLSLIGLGVVSVFITCNPYHDQTVFSRFRCVDKPHAM